MKNLEQIVRTIARNQKALMGKDIVWDMKTYDDIEGTILEEMDNNQGMVEMEPTDGQFNVTFHMLTNCYHHCKETNRLESFENRFKDYIEGLGLQLNEEVFTVLLFLHEVGHVQFEKTVQEFDILREAFMINQIQVHSLSLGFEEKDMNDLRSEGLNVPTFFNSIECHCDIYAISHFLPTWNLLKNAELVGGNQ